MHIINENKKEKAILVGVVHHHQPLADVEEHLLELELLADTADLEVVAQEIQERNEIDRAYYIGKGKAQSIASLAAQVNADVIVFDDDLSPGQVRNLERLCEIKIIDRSGIILDIFARRAKTREAKTQVELAQLQYLLPRLTRLWTHLSRQVAGAGVGLRGPGEKQLEVDRRMIRRRILHLQQELIKIEKQRDIRRQHRRQFYKVALMGYTNVGKSTLLNALTESDVFVEDRLFATLDSTIRKMQSPNKRKILLVDTVGFIRKLPHDLIASFKSTLEETNDADLLLHVIDISSASFREQMEIVQQVMIELGISEKPVLHVFNKIDQVEDNVELNQIQQQFAPAVMVSAKRKIFMDELKQKIIDFADRDVIERDIKIDINHQKKIAQIYAIASVIERQFNDGYVQLKIRIDKDNVALLDRMLESETDFLH